jgi:hypothetical protein
LSVKIFNRIPHRSPNDSLGVDIHDRGQNFRHGEHGWFRRRVALRK